MNKMHIIGFFAVFIASMPLLAVHIESVELHKADKTVRVQVRYYDDAEWQSCGSQLIDEGFNRCCNHVGVKTDDESISICGDLSKFVAPTEEYLQDTYQDMFMDDQPWILRDAFLSHYFWMNCAMRMPKDADDVTTCEAILIAHESDELCGAEILEQFKTAMQTIADSDPAIIYCETSEYN